MKALYLPFLCICLLVASCTPTNLSYTEAAERNNKKLENEEQRKDAAFMVEAADYNLLLQDLSQQALEKGYSRMLTDFAKQNLSDHETMGERLRSLAREKKFALPAQVSDRQANIVQDFKQAERRNVDRSYVNTIDTLYQRLIRLYEDTALNAHDADIRSYAAAQLDILRSHNRKARDMREKLI